MSSSSKRPGSSVSSELGAADAADTAVLRRCFLAATGHACTLCRCARAQPLDHHNPGLLFRLLQPSSSPLSKTAGQAAARPWERSLWGLPPLWAALWKFR